MHVLLLVVAAAIGVQAGHATVLETAGNNGCAKVVKVITDAGLKAALDAADGVTLFAPSDAAVDALPADLLKELLANTTLLQQVLTFHVVSGVKKAADLVNDVSLPTLSGSAKLRTNIYMGGKVVTAEGSPVSKADLMASNGVVHVIDKVIYPVPSLSTPLFLTFDKDLNNLGYLAYSAKLIQALAEDGLTVFAPSNAAIEKIPGQEYNDLLMNFTLLQSVVKFHAIKSTVFSAGLAADQRVVSLEGSQLHIKKTSGGVTVNGAKVTTADIATTNGVIHVIDTILFPPKKQEFDFIPFPIIG